MKMNAFLLVTVIFITVTVTLQSSTRETGYLETRVKGDTVKAALIKAKSLVMQGKVQEASDIYTGIMKNYPDNRDAVQGWIIANMKRIPTGEIEMLKTLKELEKSYPANTGILFFKAFLEAEQGQNEEALNDVNRLIEIQPDTALHYIGRGQVLFGMGKYKQAFEAFNKATSLDPKRQDVWGMKAASLAKMGNFDDAITSINKGLELAPNSPENLYNRACIYCLKGDKAKALEDLKKAIDLNPSFKQSATKDEDFRSLYLDEDFKKLTE